MNTHKSGIHEAFLVKRCIRLTEFSSKQATILESQIGDITGIDHIKLDSSQYTMQIAYDASVTSIDAAIEQLEPQGIKPDTGWWTGFKLGWIRQIDRNVRDNAKHQPHCCNKIPSRH